MATHSVTLPSGKTIPVIVPSGQEDKFEQNFLSVVKILQALPDSTKHPVMVNLAESGDVCPETSGSGRVDNVASQQTVQATFKPPKTPEPNVLTHWEDHQVKALLGIMKDKDNDLVIKGKNKKAIWKSIADELSKNLGVSITSDQCYDKFRNIKQSLRKHEDRRRKTGNGQPKPFKYPDIYDIVGDDPTLQPTYTCDSEGNVCYPSEVSSDSDGEETHPPPPKKIKSRSRSSLVAVEMKEMYKESQKQLQETLLTMHNQNRELLSKLIDKL